MPQRSTYYSVNQANLKFSSFSLGLGYIIKGEDILPRPKILDFFVSVFSKHFCFVFLTMASFNLWSLALQKYAMLSAAF